MESEHKQALLAEEGKLAGAIDSPDLASEDRLEEKKTDLLHTGSGGLTSQEAAERLAEYGYNEGWGEEMMNSWLYEHDFRHADE
eukprot:788395-Amorphochlora_amoeboformis.AAC.2